MDERKNCKVYEEITTRMFDQIHQGALRPGDRLPAERVLAEEYGVSRAAVREALRAMEMMGCVESRVGGGTYIKKPTLANIVEPFSLVFPQSEKSLEELIEVRLILETEVAALAARRRSPEQLAALEATLTDMAEDIQRGGNGLDADDAFHAILVHAAGNDALSVMLNMCADMLSRTRPITQSIRGVPLATLKDHTAISSAVRAQDERAARRLMRAHLNRALRNLQRRQ